MQNLLDFLARHFHWLLFLFLEAVSGILLFSYNSYQGSVWLSTANAVAGKTLEMQADVEQYFSLKRLNEELTQRNLVLEEQLRLYRELDHKHGYSPGAGAVPAYPASGGAAAQPASSVADAYFHLNDTLTHAAATAYGDSARLAPTARRSLTFIPAKVVGNTVNKRNNLITIDRGRADGVRPDMGVVSGLGLVGVVYLAGDHYSVVLPVLNGRSRISCSIRGREYFGYLTWTGGDPTKAYVEDMPRHAKFKRGDWVETSGYSSIFPHGVAVGRIEKIFNSKDGLSYRLQIHLSTDFANLRDVCIINDSSMVERMRLKEAAIDSLMLTPIKE